MKPVACGTEHIDDSDSSFGSGIGRWQNEDMALTLQLSVVLVVGMRLGCLNHAVVNCATYTAKRLNLGGLVCGRC